ncbi:lysoplasmalogenase [Paraburkholderia megapolitana]|uniref:Uncharacterized membrane protein YhhN n=1 Tax=Paraburkholderia megapolitana TaxID=420953 RepID=A0A1I3SEI5_9BURK|nr:lysoplasmalogenase [Paraburkholderia megapolitana]QDQ85784.1 lysoplasmalogenase [Paraburkholderia megapolitana]SFJ55917.1 Uncharacterized membrane protein YhhN [Paraburkholderia megapolitana]
MPQDTQAFRMRYRAGIDPRYSPWVHGGFVLAYGVLCVFLFWRTLHRVEPLEWLTVPLALVLFNWTEYFAHKHLGHYKHRLAAMFYKRHTGDHHSFFVEERMRYESAQDWRVILFPAWLIVLYSVGLFVAWWLLAKIDGNVAALFCGTMLVGYLSYEIFHACEHLPETHPLTRLPWISHMRRLHRIHHRRDLMQTYNFNIVFPLMDWLYGTLHGESGPLGRDGSTRPRLLATLTLAAVVGAILGALFMNAGDTPWRWLHWLCKPLATLLILRLAWTAHAAAPRYRSWMLRGIVLSLAGDVFLMLPWNLFVAGLVSFLLAHLCFIVALSSDTRFAARPLSVFACLGYGAVNVWLLWPTLPSALRVPVIVYVLVLATMGAQALARVWVHVAMGDSLRDSARRAAVGGLLFMLSDTLLAWDRFHAALPLSALWILASYYAAMWMLASSTHQTRRA